MPSAAETLARAETPASESASGYSTPRRSDFASSLRVGCTVLALAPDKTFRKAEIRSLQTRGGEPQFYVHFQDFNKRLDEWISLARIDQTSPPEWPKTVDKKKPVPQPKSATANGRPEDNRQAAEGVSRGHTDTTSGQGIKEANGKDDELDLVDGSNDHNKGNEPVSKEQEIDNLRTGGSMTQNIHEVSRVKNFDKIQIGRYQVEAWYFSPWPIELTSSPVLFVCEFCFSFFGSEKQFTRHKSKCDLHHPPGNEIYRDATVSFFEIDGRRQRAWCRNLCLLSKAFLDHKTLHFDVDPFLFYCMCIRDENGCHLVGYFSKEKESADGYNVACILTLPQHQRHGYGRLLIQFSYELSKREGKSGSPEKPLSDLGLLSYRAYWAETLVDLIMQAGVEVTIDELASRTSMTTADVLHTLQNLNMLKYHKGSHIIFVSEGVEQGYEKWKKKRKRWIDPAGLANWKAPVFTQAQLRFNW
ncbi:acyl-CoA N-acyltransferase [Protomyces lactucae-debilis]|uniref:Histone acetyltransferase ESA1 n=1 Tax=Protomyces lactucae-debilis TaxID=2754530 RepID=A0A1Y2FF81_PROLT|nr:acyl-CoA N-acyltransferase [Protomyces lactucae-debilis]ORY81485.1 acyl-CoA N-acyltransferase [Protomyces lactucae-debilis]